MQQHQPPELAERRLQHHPGYLHGGATYATALQAVNVDKEEGPHHADVWRGFLVSVILSLSQHILALTTAASSVTAISLLRLIYLVQFGNTTNVTRKFHVQTWLKSKWEPNKVAQRIM